MSRRAIGSSGWSRHHGALISLPVTSLATAFHVRRRRCQRDSARLRASYRRRGPQSGALSQAAEVVMFRMWLPFSLMT